MGQALCLNQNGQLLRCTQLKAVALKCCQFDRTNDLYGHKFWKIEAMDKIA